MEESIFEKLGIEQLGLHPFTDPSNGKPYHALVFRYKGELIRVDLLSLCTTRNPIDFCINEVTGKGVTNHD